MKTETNNGDTLNDFLPNLYTPTFDALNIKEQMTLSPMFTPDNAIDLHVAWIAKANTTIDLQNQYITQWDGRVEWDLDPSPLVRALVEANIRGVDIKVQIRDDADTNGIISDDIAAYLIPLGIEVRYMGSVDTDSGDGFLSATHNKMILIDDKISLISSINFGENAFTNNREAGMIIQSSTVTNYYKSVFVSDWEDGEIPLILAGNNIKSNDKNTKIQSTYTSHTSIPKANFTGSYNVTAFVNPDSADEIIFNYLKSAKTSIYVSMYTISRIEFTDTLIALKKSNPSIDIQVLISNRRVSSPENTDTHNSAQLLVDNLIPVFNSTKDDDKVDGFYHNKYWIIDEKHTFIYSGNWSPKSVTPQLEEGDNTYASSTPNRDMGIAVHNAADIASFVKTEVWDKDVAVSDAWDLGVGIKQLSFDESDVISGKIDLKAQITDIEPTTVSYKFGTSTFTEVTLSNNQFMISFDTLSLPNGITTFEVKAEADGQIFTDEVSVNIVNYHDTENWRFLITEVLPDPVVVSDAEGEFIELTNSFPFDLLISDWKIGDDNNVHVFNDGTVIKSYSSIIFARNTEGFSKGFGKEADYQLGISLTNSGDLIQLINHKNEIIDALAFGSKSSPDGSDVLETPAAGISIQRSPLHIDTNSKNDFVYLSPSPKSEVPNITLYLPGDSRSDTEETFGITYLLAISSLGAILIIRLKKLDL